MKLLRHYWIPAIVAVLGLAAACGGNAGETSAGHAEEAHSDEISVKPFEGTHPLKVVTTTGMIADIARNVGGVHVAVRALMGEGVDPHLYKATPGDIEALRGADLILYNGLHLEGKMADILGKLAETQPAFPVTRRIDPDRLRKPPEFDGNYDPHLWFDVALWAECAGFVAEVLIAADPSNADDYRRQADAYRAELDRLHDYARQQIATVPADRRLLITAHDAFGYFGRAYAIDVLAIQGISTESEAGVYKINELVSTIVGRNVKAVFVETSVSDKNIRALVEGCRARGHELKIGGALFSDAMGAEGTGEGTYPGMVRHNVDTIVEALK